MSINKLVFLEVTATAMAAMEFTAEATAKTQERDVDSKGNV